VNKWEWLITIIPIGRAAALSMSYLANLLGISNRELRKEIESARRDGVLICSCDKGYFMPETMTEIKEHAQRAKARIRTGGQCLAPFLREIMRAGGE